MRHLCIITVLSIILLASCAKPLAQFQFTDEARQAPSKVAFENQSEKAESYEWDFGDGKKSTDASPSHQYEEAGTYTISLKAMKGKKENIITQTITIAETPLVVDFDFEMKSKTAPVEVQFNNKSTGADSYQWEFGDYGKSKEASPSHKYRFSGNYTVKLTAMKGNKKEVIEKQVIIDAPDKECLVEIETSFGTMVVKLYNETPKHRDNFLKLVDEGYYDDLLFHRVINGFMIQGGDPDSKNAKPNQMLGMGGPGYMIPAEFNTDLLHVQGALAAARNNNPQKSSSGSQFYIVQGRPSNERELEMLERRKGFKYTQAQKEHYKTVGGAPFLDQDYTVFGQIVKGMDVMVKIAAANKNKSDRPVKDIKMKIRSIK